jgi:Tfp pilus assembly protein PilV
VSDNAAEAITSSRGCSLLEVLVATTFLVVSLTAVAQLFAVAAHTGHRAKETTFAAVLAQRKMEELVPAAASGAGSDFVDAQGNVLGAGVTPPSDAVYRRRWSIEPLSTSPADTLVVQVLVTGAHARSGETTIGGMVLPGEAFLVTLRRRKAS